MSEFVQRGGQIDQCLMVRWLQIDNPSKCRECVLELTSLGVGVAQQEQHVRIVRLVKRLDLQNSDRFRNSSLGDETFSKAKW